MMTKGTLVSRRWIVCTRPSVVVPWAKLRGPASSIEAICHRIRKGMPTSIAETPSSSKNWMVSCKPAKPFHDLLPWYKEQRSLAAGLSTFVNALLRSFHLTLLSCSRRSLTCTTSLSPRPDKQTIIDFSGPISLANFTTIGNSMARFQGWNGILLLLKAIERLLGLLVCHRHIGRPLDVMEIRMLWPNSWIIETCWNREGY